MDTYMKKTIALLGSTGNTGSIATEILLQNKDIQVRVTGRSAEKLAHYAEKGAEVFVGDQADASFLTKVFSGADLAYLVIPSNLQIADYKSYANQLSDAFVTAIKQSGLKNVVFLSSLGAEHATGTGPITGLHQAEEKLKSISGLNVLSLRAGYFMANYFGSLGMIKHNGINGGAIKANIPIAHVAPSDIGKVAAEELVNFNTTGFEIKEVYASKLATSAEVTSLLGNALGKPELPYIEFSGADFKAGLVGAGLSESMAEMFVEMAEGMNSGLIQPTQNTDDWQDQLVTVDAFIPYLVSAYAAN
jgi:uncharacterized protein YbjT (DUF2867 family)